MSTQTNDKLVADCIRAAVADPEKALAQVNEIYGGALPAVAAVPLPDLSGRARLRSGVTQNVELSLVFGGRRECFMRARGEAPDLWHLTQTERGKVDKFMEGVRRWASGT